MYPVWMTRARPGKVAGTRPGTLHPHQVISIFIDSIDVLRQSNAEHRTVLVRGINVDRSAMLREQVSADGQAEA